MLNSEKVEASLDNDRTSSKNPLTGLELVPIRGSIRLRDPADLRVPSFPGSLFPRNKRRRITE